MNVLVSPEHARLATLANLQIPFVVWSILRDDIRANNTNGHYSKNHVKSLCKALGYTTRHWTRIFNSGHLIFWGNDDKMIHIRSIKWATKQLEKITKQRIDTRDIFQKHVTIDVTRKDTTQSVYAKLYWSWFMGRGEVTIARDTLQEIFGLSHDQQRAYEAILGKKILIKSNYCLVDTSDYTESPETLPEHHSIIGYERLTADSKLQRIQAIHYQLPNTYKATSACNGDNATTTAPQSLVRANSARLWYASYPHKQSKLYFANWHEFEHFATKESYVRTYFNGKRCVWRSGHFI